MEASHIDLEKDELEDIVQFLPQRFRQIAASSTALERFNLLNDDLISHRILPGLHTHLRLLILNARLPGPFVNRIRHLLDTPRTPPSSNCSVLFALIVKGYESLHELKFVDFATRDKRLPRLPNQAFERPDSGLTFPTFNELPYKMVAVGQKVVCWKLYDPRNSFTYIMNAAHSGDWVLRPLDTSIVCQEIQRESAGSSMYLYSVVGHRLVTFLNFTGDQPITYRLCLDVDTERWSLLPQCPLDTSFDYIVPISWQGKLYLLNTDKASDVKEVIHYDINLVVPTHFDFHRNLWIQSDVNTAFGRRVMELPREFFSRQFPQLRWIISSRSGTLYALSEAISETYRILGIYAMDDIRSGWRRVELRRSVFTREFDPFSIPPLPSHISKSQVYSKTNWWAVNEQDILLLYLQLGHGFHTWGRCTWWIFNSIDGVKYYNCEELSAPCFQNGVPYLFSKTELI